MAKTMAKKTASKKTVAKKTVSRKTIAKKAEPPVQQKKPVKGKAIYDRSAEDIGNSVALEHVNVCIPDQRLSTLFYVTGLGLTRDPYLVTSTNNMWVNVGKTQFHLPTNKPLVVRGITGIVMPDRNGLLKRLQRVKNQLKGTKFSFKAERGFVEATCPWGNRFRIHTPSKRFGRTRLGIVYVEFPVPKGNAAGIARFYEEIVGAPAKVKTAGGAKAAHVTVGYSQELIYRETTAKIAPFDGHHIQIYVADFSGPYDKLRERGLITEESNQHQYRFEDIVDPDTNEVLFTLDHEMRSLTHPLFARPLVNRHPDRTNQMFSPGNEGVSWALEDPEPAPVPVG
ncbi:MAG: hypothetical protein VW405_20010 [Rhodospirillaceae bacterium]